MMKKDPPAEMAGSAVIVYRSDKEIHREISNYSNVYTVGEI